MKILIAPNAFKECLSAIEVANAIEKGKKRVVPDADIIKCSVADGGDGLLEVLEQNLNCRKVSKQVSGPFFKKVYADFLLESKK